MSTKSQRMIDAANKHQEEFMQNELKEKTGRDYSEWMIWEMIQEMKRLADEIKAAYAPKDGKPTGDVSDCCGKPITFEKDSSPVCTKCDQDCGALSADMEKPQ